MPHLYRDSIEHTITSGDAQASIVDQKLINKMKAEVFTEINSKLAQSRFDEHHSFPSPEIVWILDEDKNLVGYKQVMHCSYKKSPDETKETKSAPAAPEEADAILTIELKPIYNQDSKIIGWTRTTTFELNDQILEPDLERSFPNTNLQLEIDALKAKHAEEEKLFTTNLTARRNAVEDHSMDAYFRLEEDTLKKSQENELEEKQAEIITLNRKQLEKVISTAEKLAAKIETQLLQFIIMALLEPENDEIQHLFKALQTRFRFLPALRTELSKFDIANEQFLAPNYIAQLNVHLRELKQKSLFIKEHSASIKSLVASFSDKLDVDARTKFLLSPRALLHSFLSSAEATLPQRLRKIYATLQPTIQRVLEKEVAPHLEQLDTIEIDDRLWPADEKSPNYHQATCFHDILSAFKTWNQRKKLTFKIVLDFYQQYYAGLKVEYRNQLNAWLQQPGVLPGQNKQQVWDVVAKHLWLQTNNGTDYSRSNFQETFLVFSTSEQIYDLRLKRWYQQCYASGSTSQKKQVERWRTTILSQKNFKFSKELGRVAREKKPSSLCIADNWKRLNTTEKVLLVTVGVLGSAVLGLGAVGVYLYLNHRRENDDLIYPNAEEQLKKRKPAVSDQRQDIPSLIRKFFSPKPQAGQPTSRIVEKLSKTEQKRAAPEGKRATSDHREISERKAEEPASQTTTIPQPAGALSFLLPCKNICDFVTKNSSGKNFLSDKSFLKNYVVEYALAFRTTVEKELSQLASNPSNLTAVMHGPHLLIDHVAGLLELILRAPKTSLEQKALLARAFLKDIFAPCKKLHLDLSQFFEKLCLGLLAIPTTEINAVPPNVDKSKIKIAFLEKIFLPEELRTAAMSIRKQTTEYMLNVFSSSSEKRKAIEESIGKVFAKIIDDQHGTFANWYILTGKLVIKNITLSHPYGNLTDYFSVNDLFTTTIRQLQIKVSPVEKLQRVLNFFSGAFGEKVVNNHTLDSAVQKYYEEGLERIDANRIISLDEKILLWAELRNIAKQYLKSNFREVPTAKYAGLHGWNGDGPLTLAVEPSNNTSTVATPIVASVQQPDMHHPILTPGSGKVFVRDVDPNHTCTGQQPSQTLGLVAN